MIEGGYCDQQSPCLSDVSFALWIARVWLHFTALQHKCISISDCPKEWYEIYFVFACVWAFGAAMFHDQVQKYIYYYIKHSVRFGGYLNVI
jgi:hypothetical protein